MEQCEVCGKDCTDEGRFCRAGKLVCFACNKKFRQGEGVDGQTLL